MFSISNTELGKLLYAEDVANKDHTFEVVHTHKDGSTEICTVKRGIMSSGEPSWSIGYYTTTKGDTILAVVAGKVLKRVVLHQDSK